MSKLHMQVTQNPMSPPWLHTSDTASAHTCGHLCRNLIQPDEGGKSQVFVWVGGVYEWRLKVNSSCITATFRVGPERQWGEKSQWAELGTVHLIIDFVWKKKYLAIKKIYGFLGRYQCPVNRTGAWKGKTTTEKPWKIRDKEILGNSIWMEWAWSMKMF